MVDLRFWPEALKSLWQNPILQRHKDRSGYSPSVLDEAAAWPVPAYAQELVCPNSSGRTVATKLRWRDVFAAAHAEWRLF
jgi:hypothetical protein